MFLLQLLDFGFFSLFFYLSPLCPGTCARSTDSFSPIISEISPTYSGVIICPFMTQQSSSILIFGTFIVTHSFAICSFRHWIGSDAAPCWHLLHTHTELGTNFHLNRDSLLGLVAHLLLSYTHNNHKHSHSSPISVLQTVPSPLIQLNLHNSYGKYIFLLRLVSSMCYTLYLTGFFNTPIWRLICFPWFTVGFFVVDGFLQVSSFR